MIRAVVSLGFIFMLTLGAVSDVGAQLLNNPRSGEEVATVSLRLGLLAPRTTFTDPVGGESSFDNGVAAGLSVAVWPTFGNRVGLRGTLIRSATDGQNSTSEFAPIAVNDPTVYLYMLEAAGRLPMESGSPYLSLGYGGKHYTWKETAHKVSRFAAMTAAAGYEYRVPALGPFGVNAEIRAYRSNFRAFGIDDGSWEDGPYGGKVGGVKNLDLLFTTGFSMHF